MKKSMKRDRLAIVVCATILFIAVFQIFYYHSQLPSMVASHFNLQGKPDGWSTKAAFFLMYSGIMTLLAVTFLGFHFFLPKIPVALISLPGKDYWTAPERREETCRVLASSMLWFGDIVLVYMVVIFQGAIEANMSSDRTMGMDVLIATGLFISTTAIWTIGLFMRFRRPRKRLP